MYKKNETSPKQCGKCDCLIASDPQGAEKCFNTRMNAQTYQLPDESSTDGFVIPTNCNETIKIYVKGVCKDDDRSSYATQTSVPAFSKFVDQPKKMQPVSQKIQSKPKLQPNPKTSKKLQTDAKPLESKISQFNCFGWCGKKKKTEDSKVKGPEESKSQEVAPKEEKLPEGKADADVGDTLRPSPKQPIPRISSPKDKSKGDGSPSLDSFIRMEAKITRLQLEDILNELHKQKRDLNELKDMLDVVARSVREQLFISTFGKGKSELLHDMNRKNNLERKSNSLSLTKQVSEEIPPPHKASLCYTEEPGEETKKKRGFPWCI